MQVLKFSAIAMIACTLATGAFAGECTRVAAVGDGPTQTIATIMSTHGLQNIIDNRGLKGTGPVKTTCQDGTILTQCHSSQTACK